MKENLTIKIKLKDMITIKTKVSVTQEKVIELEVPAFFSTGGGYGCVAVIDEDNVYRVCHMDSFSYIQNGTTESLRSDLSYCTEENRITEEAFIKLYNQAREMTDLNPRLLLKNITAKEGSVVVI